MLTRYARRGMILQTIKAFTLSGSSCGRTR